MIYHLLLLIDKPIVILNMANTETSKLNLSVYKMFILKSMLALNKCWNNIFLRASPIPFSFTGLRRGLSGGEIMWPFAAISALRGRWMFSYGIHPEHQPPWWIMNDMTNSAYIVCEPRLKQWRWQKHALLIVLDTLVELWRKLSLVMIILEVDVFMNSHDEDATWRQDEIRKQLQ